ncbi:hypothetical protein FRC10_011201 [Ceratobasidium sp. 414]|nr:hypothetical protein FRC10_011201 [Ceratobasidium sp. 414]
MDRKCTRDDKQVADAWGVVESGGNNEIQPHVANKQQHVALSVLKDIPNMFSTSLPDQQLHVRYPSEDRDDEIREVAPLFSQQLSAIVYNYPLQIIAKAPNKQAREDDEGKRGSWCSVDSLAHADVNFNTFVNRSEVQRLFKSHNDFG